LVNDAHGWEVFLRQLHDAYPEGFDPTYVIEDEAADLRLGRPSRFTFPAGVGGEKSGAPRWMWLNCEFKNRTGQIFGGLKLTHAGRSGVVIEGVTCNTMFWWRVVDVEGL
jgi:hypothetical protein